MFVCVCSNGVIVSQVQFSLGAASFPSSLSARPVVQDTLRELWKAGRPDRLSLWMQARALAYREASKELSAKKVPNVAWVASKLARGDGGPVPGAVCKAWACQIRLHTAHPFVLEVVTKAWAWHTRSQKTRVNF